MHVEQWIESINSETNRAENLVDKIDEEQLNLSPAPGKWSIGELIDHIATTNQTFFTVFETIGNGEYSNPSLLWIKVIPKALGNMVLKSITPETKKKYKTVPIFKPSSNTHTLDVINDFKDQQSKLINLVKKMDGMELDKIWIRSPASPIILYPLAGALNMILDHEKRHLGQAEEIFEKFGA